jgi:hypothetical protein
MHALVLLPSEFHAPRRYKQLIEKYQIVTAASKYRYCRVTGEERYKSSNARIDLQRFDPKRNASGYLTKYLLKDIRAEYDIYHQA